LILIVPYSVIYGGQELETDELTWNNFYVFREIDLFKFYIPLFLLTIAIQLAKSDKIRKGLLILNTLLCCSCSLAAPGSMSLPMQDYVPSYGTLLMVTVGPLMLIITKIEYNK
jgi:hypothetical protein